MPYIMWPYVMVLILTYYAANIQNQYMESTRDKWQITEKA